MKKHILHITKTFFLLIFLFAQTSCINEEVCEDIATVPIRIGFYEENEDDVDEPDPITLDSLTVFGLGNDSVIYNNRYNVAQIELPLDSQRDSCAFIMVFPQTPSVSLQYDTIWFYYKRKPTLVSMECGFSTFYELNDITFSRNKIDSITLDNANIRNTIDEHVKIFPDSIAVGTR